jgi:hypothetical protein
VQRKRLLWTKVIGELSSKKKLSPQATRPADHNSVWRPLNGPIQDHPLTICDTRTLADEDLVPSDIVLPHTLLEAYDLWYNPKQEWWFLDQQKNNEVLLMINYDSELNIRKSSHLLIYAANSLGAAHSAFQDPRSPANAVARHSLELRCMVFY